jgi:hypothetical protein
LGAGGKIIVNTLGSGDSLTVDFSLGDFGHAVEYNGGDPAVAPGDGLTLIGGSFTNATYNFTAADSGNMTLDTNSITYTGLEPISSTVTATNVSLNYSGSDDTIVVDELGVSTTQLFVTSTAAENIDFTRPTGSLTIDAGGGTDSLRLDTALTGHATALTADVLDINENVTATGASAIVLTGDQHIEVAANLTFNTVDGDLKLLGNPTNTAYSLDQISIDLNNTTITTTNGAIAVSGRGGDTGSFNHGVYIHGTTTIQSTGSTAAAGAITITGTGGDANGSDRGVSIESTGDLITSAAGDITVTGQSSNTDGVRLFSGPTITSTSAGADAADITISSPRTVRIDGTVTTVDGDVSLMANQQATPTNADFIGLYINGATLTTTGDGDISLAGRGGAVGSFNYGAFIFNGSTISTTSTATDAGKIVIAGEGGAADGSDRGVQIEGSSTAITSSFGEIDIDGTGGANGDFNHGVLVFNQAKITSTSTAAIPGAINIDGTGGAGTGSDRGVSIESSSTQISSVSADINITGQSTNTDGVGIFSGTSVTSSSSGADAADITISSPRTVRIDGTVTTVDGDVSLMANQQATPTNADFVGLYINGATLTTTGDGDISLAGRGGAVGSFNYGARILNGSTISTTSTATDAGKIVIAGEGGAAGGSDRGVQIEGSSTAITSSFGEIDIDGTGGANGGFNYGVLVSSQAKITSTSTAAVPGAINIDGTGGAGTGSDRGVSLESSSTQISSVSADINITGSSPDQYGVLVATGVDVDSTGSGGTAANINISSQRIVRVEGDVSTVDGKISLQANQQATPTSGNFSGLDVNGGSVTASGVGAIDLRGRGGDTDSFNYGVYVHNGALVESTSTSTSSGDITINGTGGESDGQQDNGVFLRNTTTKITSKFADIKITGAALGTSTAGSPVTGDDFNRGVFI